MQRFDIREVGQSPLNISIVMIPMLLNVIIKSNKLNKIRNHILYSRKFFPSPNNANNLTQFFGNSQPILKTA